LVVHSISGFFISATSHVVYSRCDSARPNALSCEAGHYVETYFMSDDIAVLRQEVRQQFTQLTESTNKMAESVAELTSLVARIEERNINHVDGMKRIGKVLDDHETRIRSNEKAVVKMTVIASVASFAVGIAVNIGLKVLL
jgi:hypothetical protein